MGFGSEPSRGNPLGRSPGSRLAVFLLLELWLLLQIPESILRDSQLARDFVSTMAAIAPVVHHFDRVAAKPGVLAFFLAISPFLLVPKIIFAVQWLKSDKLRICRYFVVSPLTRSVPKGPLDFVTDPLRDSKENESPKGMTPITMVRRIVLSLFMLCSAALMGIFYPWGLFGVDVAKGGALSLIDAAVAQGGWKLWLSWSVYQMTFAAGFLAIGYCILEEYGRWFGDLLRAGYTAVSEFFGRLKKFLRP